MKALVFIFALLTISDLTFDHGKGVGAVVRAGHAFARDFAEDLEGSIFAA